MKKANKLAKNLANIINNIYIQKVVDFFIKIKKIL